LTTKREKKSWQNRAKPQGSLGLPSKKEGKTEITRKGEGTGSQEKKTTRLKAPTKRYLSTKKQDKAYLVTPVKLKEKSRKEGVVRGPIKRKGLLQGFRKPGP